MSASESSGMFPNRDSFAVAGGQQPPPSQSPAMQVSQSMGLAYTADGTPVYKPVPGLSAHTLNVNSSEATKRKRGRPRKYGPDGSMAMGLVPATAPAQQVAATDVTPPGPGGNPSPPIPQASAGIPLPPGTPSSPSSSMKKRGRPPGSRKKQNAEDLGSAGIGFTSHVIIVRPGEDISAKIMSFSQQGPRAICIMSATGYISNVTLRQPATSGGTATYEGRFEILCLSGSFLPSEVGGHRSRTGGLSVTINGSDGEVFGGCVAGLLIAASPVQVIVGSFMPDGHKEVKSVNYQEQFPAPSNFHQLGASGASSPPSRGTFSESSGGPNSPLNQNSQGMASIPWK